MSEHLTPTQIAREALRLLAARRLGPTPENFRAMYEEIAGVEVDSTERAADYRLRVALNTMLATGAPQDLIVALNTAVAERTWRRARAALTVFAEAECKKTPAGAAPGEPPVAAAAETPAARDGRAGADEATAVAHQRDVFRDLLANLLVSSLVRHLSEEDDLLKEGRGFAERIATAKDATAVTTLASDIQRFINRLEARAEDVKELRDDLHRLLLLLIDNISGVIVEDTWIMHQLKTVREIVTRPSAGGMIDEAERYLREVLGKQHAIKHSLTEAKATLKSLVSSFMEHLATISTDTGEYSRKIERYTARIREGDDIASLRDVLGELLRDTQDMQDRAAATAREVVITRERAQAAEKQIQDLQQDLVRVSEKLREDHLTGTLNRRGLDTAFAREASRASRQSSSLSVALLDVDNFKNINDTHGHGAGDEALVHLSQVILKTVRPNDVVARYGGEEFLVLLPDTDLNSAVAVVTRLQRELTKRMFLHASDQLLITFSAGVALWRDGESQDAVIQRADAAQYKAKRLGKNKVVVASDGPEEPSPANAMAAVPAGNGGN